MGQVNQPSNLLDRIKRAETQVSQLWRAIGLSSATIAKGGLTLLNNAFIKMLGAAGNELVYIGPDGGNQVVRIRDAAGNIIFGNISAGTGGQRVAINPEPTNLPRIDIYDDTTSDHVTQVMFSGNFLMQRETNGVRAVDGGKLFFQAGQTFLSHQTAAGESFLNLLDDTGIIMKGRWTTSQTISGLSAVYTGSIDVSSAFSGLVVVYGATMASRMCPVFSLFVNAGNVTDQNIDSESATGFGIHWSPVANVRVNFWNFRTEQAF